MSELPFGADIRGFYAALGITIPAWATSNANVRCFTAPEQHKHGDAHPSTSVSLLKDAWKCHGCGARGRAFNAALAKGHDARSAVDLMITHGLADRKYRLFSARELAAHSPIYNRTRPTAPPAPLRANDADVRQWQRALDRRPIDRQRLRRERGWSVETMRELELGLHRGRITIPIRDEQRALIAVLRYQPHDTGRPKMLAVAGCRLGLIPHPVHEASTEILLVEGPPDMITARSHGLPAIAVPGDHAWRDDWAGLFARRRVTIVMDADAPGRDAAERIQQALSCVTTAHILDLALDRDDGYDLTDWIADHPADAVTQLLKRRGTR